MSIVVSGTVQTGIGKDASFTAQIPVKQRNLKPDERILYDEAFWDDGGPGARSALEKYRRNRSRNTES